MSTAPRASGSSARRLFATHAAISLVPVVLIGLLLAHSYASEAQKRGLAEARAQSELIAANVIEPELDDVDLRYGMSKQVKDRLGPIAERSAAEGSILRMRVRDLDGKVVYSSDGSGLDEQVDEDAVEAGEGAPVAELTKLNSDANDVGPAGDDVVEVYRGLHTGVRTVGVLELYLPYAPIRDDVSAGLSALYRDLALGLFVLYIVLAGLSLTTTRRVRRQAEANVYLAEHDQLTGLPNRDAFLAQVDALGSADPPRLGAVAILDLDRFKDVNDTLGHDNGDELLRRVAARLTATSRPGDVVARLGGDEFGLILNRVATADQTDAALRRFVATVAEPLQITDLPLTVEASVGYALVPEDGTDAQSLLQRADIAMYVAKASGMSVVRYNESHDHFDADRLAVVGELHRALSEDELVLHFQPQLDLRDGAVHTVEALIRWNHPRHGLLQPDTFLPIAEQTGLIDPLTDWVLDHALGQLVAWERDGLTLRVAVNVSARNLTHPDFVDRVTNALHQHDLDPSRLVLEITETAVFTDIEKATKALDRLRDAGLRISLDDFGQGQTSLGFLARLPVSELKIDRAFVTPMSTDVTNAAIVRSVIELAHNLGMAVVAEGAEDAGTVDALRVVECDTVQGFTIARPMPAADVAGWVHASTTVPTH